MLPHLSYLLHHLLPSEVLLLAYMKQYFICSPTPIYLQFVLVKLETDLESNLVWLAEPRTYHFATPLFSIYPK